MKEKGLHLTLSPLAQAFSQDARCPLPAESIQPQHHSWTPESEESCSLHHEMHLDFLVFSCFLPMDSPAKEGEC